MAENDKFRSAEDIEKELSVGNFAAQQVKTIGYTFGGAGIGAAAGYLANKAGLADFIKNRNWKWAEEFSHSKMGHYVIGAGAMIGLFMIFLASGDEHWRKGKKEQLGVEKITNDIDLAMKSRVEFENTLGRQAEVIKAMREKLEAEKSGSLGDQVMTAKESAASSERVR